MSSNAFNLNATVKIVTTKAFNSLDALENKAISLASYLTDLDSVAKTSFPRFKQYAGDVAHLRGEIASASKVVKTLVTQNGHLRKMNESTAESFDKLRLALTTPQGMKNAGDKLWSVARKGIDAFDKIDKAIKATNSVLHSFQENLLDTYDYFVLLNKEAIQHSRIMTNVRRSYQNVRKNIQSVRKASSHLIQGFNQSEKAARKAAGGVTKLGKESKKTKKTMGMLGHSVSSFLGNLSSQVAMEFWFAFTSGAREALDVMVDFNNAVAEMNGLAKLSGGNLASVREQLRTIGARTGVGASPARAANAVEAIMAAGVSDPQQAVGMVDASVQLAKGGKVSEEEAAELLAGTMQAFGADASEAYNYANMLIKVTDMGLIDIGRMKQSMGRLSPIAAGAGVSAQETSAMVGTATQGGLRATSAITGLSTAITSLIKQTATTQKAIKELGLEDLNIGSESIREKGFAGVLQEIQDRTGGGADVWAKLLPKEAAVAVQAAMVEGGKLLQKNIMFAENDGIDSLGKRIEEAMKSASSQIDLFRSNMESFIIFVLSKVEPAVASIFKSLNDNPEVFNKIAQELQVVAQSLIVALSGPGVKQALSWLSDNISTITEVIFGVANGIKFVLVSTLETISTIKSILKGTFLLITLAMNTAIKKVLEAQRVVDDFMGMDTKGLDISIKLTEESIKEAKQELSDMADEVSERGIFANSREEVAAIVKGYRLREKLRKEAAQGDQAFGPEKIPGTSDALLSAIGGKGPDKYKSGVTESGTKFVTVNGQKLTGKSLDAMIAAGQVDASKLPDGFLGNQGPLASGYVTPKKVIKPKAKEVDLKDQITALDRRVTLEEISKKEAVAQWQAMLKQATTADDIYKIKKKIMDLNKDIAKNEQKTAKEARKMHIEWLESVKGKTAGKLAKLDDEKGEKLAAGVDPQAVESWYAARRRIIEKEDKADKKKIADKKAKEAMSGEKKKLTEESDLKRAQGDDLNADLLKLEADYTDEIFEYRDKEEDLTRIKKVYEAKRLQIIKDHAKKAMDLQAQLVSDTKANEVAVLEAKGKTEEAKNLESERSYENDYLRIRNRVVELRKKGVEEIAITKFIKSEQDRIKNQAANNQNKVGGKKSPVMSMAEAFGSNDDEDENGFSLGTFSIGGKKGSDPASKNLANKAANKLEGLKNPESTENLIKTSLDVNIKLLDTKNKVIGSKTISDAKSNNEANLRHSPKRGKLPN